MYNRNLRVVILCHLICPAGLNTVNSTPKIWGATALPPGPIVATALECNPNYPKLYRRPCLSLSILVQVICDAITHQGYKSLSLFFVSCCWMLFREVEVVEMIDIFKAVHRIQNQIPKSVFTIYLQLNKYETASNFIQLNQNLTSDCLLIQLNLPVFTSSCMS